MWTGADAFAQARTHTHICQRLTSINSPYRAVRVRTSVHSPRPCHSLHKGGWNKSVGRMLAAGSSQTTREPSPCHFLRSCLLRQTLRVGLLCECWLLARHKRHVNPHCATFFTAVRSCHKCCALVCCDRFLPFASNPNQLGLILSTT